MPVIPGKPGTRRYRGRMLAQMAKGAQMLNALLRYNTKLSERTPPVVFLTGPQVTTLTNASLLLQQLEAVVNT